MPLHIQKFSVGICRRILPWEFAVEICHRNLPWELAMENCCGYLPWMFCTCLYMWAILVDIEANLFLYEQNVFIVTFSLLTVFLFVTAVAVTGHRNNVIFYNIHKKLKYSPDAFSDKVHQLLKAAINIFSELSRFIFAIYS